MVAFSTETHGIGPMKKRKHFPGFFVRECLRGDKSYVSADETDIIAVWI